MRSVRRKHAVSLVAALSAAFICASGGRAATTDADCGFFCASDSALSGERRLRVAGPVFEMRTAADGARFLAVRPLFSHERRPDLDQSTTELLWPLSAVKDIREQRYWRFITAFGLDVDRDDPDSEQHFFVLPVVFAGRDRDGGGYFALFPAGGKIKELFIGRDMAFVFFPLYAEVEHGGISAVHVLWPVFSRTTGPGISGFKVFPLYGRLSRESGGSSDVSVFVLWPVWSHRKTDRGEGMILFPLWAWSKTDKDRGVWILPPFFRFIRSDKGVDAFCPWPFVQTGPRKLYIWPVWGRKETDGTVKSFFLWPIVRRENSVYADTKVSRFSVIPLMSYERLSDKPEGVEPAVSVKSIRFKLWPVVSYRRIGKESAVKLPDLWPAGRPAEVERNLAPLWTLYSRDRLSGETEDELLWGLVRRRSGGPERSSVSVFPLISWERDGSERRCEWALLKGLFGYKRHGDERSYTFMYVFRRGE